MNGVTQPLLDYIAEQAQKGIPREYIKRTLVQNDWQEGVIDEAFRQLNTSMHGTQPQNTAVVSTEHSATSVDEVRDDAFMREGVTMDKIIEKFIPIVGALLLIVGFGYLIYANAWVNLSKEIRLGLGFFFSVALIGGSFSFSEKMRYFADIGIGSGVLLLYGTLIYGSRATETAQAMIPEIASLLSALLFTIAVAYFASKRNSKVILMLGMAGAYITPFVIGQHDVWVNNVSFNAYLIYFFAINVSVFLIGKEISVRDIIPLNIIGLFVGVSTLWGLADTAGINIVRSDDVFTGELFTGILFAALVIFSMWSILLSAKKFKENDDGYLSLGYIAPVIWFAFNIANLGSLSDTTVGLLYVAIAAACFLGWHMLLDTAETKFQHTALYASGLISALLAVFALFEEFNVATSMFIAYASLVFALLYLLLPGKTERFLSYIIVSLAGSVLSLHHILEANTQYETLLIVAALLPAMAAYFIAKGGSKPELVPSATVYSVIWSIVALMFVLADIIEYINLDFLLFYVAPLMFLSYLAYVNAVAPGRLSYDSRSRMLRAVLFWFAFGFIPIFFWLVVSIYPAPTNVYLFTHPEAPIDWVMVKGVFATAILFIGLWISRKLQMEQVIKRPSFILVIFGFATLLLTGNYFISAIANDLQVSLEHGGPRAIATTIWWALLAVYMLYKGVKFGKKYHAEKLLGLMLLGITLGKVVLYDIATMGMQNKIIVLMFVGGAMLLFSYMVKTKNLLDKSPE